MSAANGTGAVNAVTWEAVAVADPHRVIDAETGVTRGDLPHFAAWVAPRLLRELDGRTLTLLCAPHGTSQSPETKRHAGPTELLGLRRIPSPHLSTPDSCAPDLPTPDLPARLGITCEEGLLHALLSGCLEFQTSNVRHPQVDRPDRLVFDLDPGPGTQWAHVLQATALLRAVLEEVGLKSFLKTSGGRGLHVLVPISPTLCWQAVQGVAEAFGAHLRQRFPERIALSASDAAGRVCIDPRRNGLDGTLVAAYSPRARPGLGVSVPVRWNELTTLTGGAHWTLQSLPQRLASLSSADPWAGYHGLNQPLDGALRALGFPPIPER